MPISKKKCIIQNRKSSFSKTYNDSRLHCNQTKVLKFFNICWIASCTLSQENANITIISLKTFHKPRFQPSLLIQDTTNLQRKTEVFGRFFCETHVDSFSQFFLAKRINLINFSYKFPFDYQTVPFQSSKRLFYLIISIYIYQKIPEFAI